MRGRVLTAIMQTELDDMLSEGFDKSPITAAALHARLKKKGFIKGGLSTFSTTERKLLIEEYRNKQIAQSDLSKEEKKVLQEHKRQTNVQEKTPSSATCEACSENQRKLNINTVKVVRVIEQAEKQGMDTDLLFADLVCTKD